MVLESRVCAGAAWFKSPSSSKATWSVLADGDTLLTGQYRGVGAGTEV